MFTTQCQLTAEMRNRAIWPACSRVSKPERFRNAGRDSDQRASSGVVPGEDLVSPVESGVYDLAVFG